MGSWLLRILGTALYVSACAQAAEDARPGTSPALTASTTPDSSAVTPGVREAPGRLTVTGVQMIPGRTDMYLVSLGYDNAEQAWIYLGAGSHLAHLRAEARTGGNGAWSLVPRTAMDSTGSGLRLVESFSRLLAWEEVPRSAGPVRFVLELTPLGAQDASQRVEVVSRTVDPGEASASAPVAPATKAIASNGMMVIDAMLDGVPQAVLEEGLPWVYQGGSIYVAAVVAEQAATLQDCLRADGYPDALVSLGPDEISGVMRELRFRIQAGNRLAIGTITGGPPWLQVLAGQPYSHRNQVRLGSAATAAVHRTLGSVDITLP